MNYTPKPTPETPVRELSRFSKTYHALTATLAASTLFTGTWLFAASASLKDADKTSLLTVTMPVFALAPLAVLAGYNLYDFGKRRMRDRYAHAPVAKPKTFAQPLSGSIKTSLTEKEHTAILRSGIRRVERDLLERLALLERQDDATLALLAGKQDIVLGELTETERATFLAGEKNRLSRELERIEFMRQDINRLLGQGADPYVVWLDQLSASEAAAGTETK